MKKILFITKGSDLYELKINKVSKSRASFPDEHKITLQDIQLPDEDDNRPLMTYGNNFSISFSIPLPENAEESAEAILMNMVRNILLKNNDKNELTKYFYTENEAVLEAQEFSRKSQIGIGEDTKTLDDVILNDSVMQKLKQTLQFLNKSEKYAAIGAEIPKNLLLYGSPGCGKTLIVKALGGETGRSVFTASASEFAEKYVGVGPKKVRALFKKARENRPSIVFIDEIDCVAMKRSDKTNSEDLKILNQLLTELDGVSDNKDITVICATNRPDILDPAFIRSGRFDRKIKIDKPNFENRIKMFELYLSKVKHKKNIDLELLAELTEGCNGADIKAIVNESAILAVDRDLTKVSMNELKEKTMEILEKEEEAKKFASQKVNVIGF